MKIAIIAAMEEEVRPLREKLINPKTTQVAGTVLEEGLLNGQEVILVQSQIGKANAAMSTAILIERFAPDFIINTGSAGGMDKSLSVGDIVVSSESRYSDVDATVFEYVLGQVPEMPASFTTEEKYVALSQTVFSNTNWPHRVVDGLILTADAFMDDKKRVAEIYKNFPNARAAEMEGAAIHQVAYQYGVPFINIRALSDIAGEEAGKSFNDHLDLAADHSMLFVEKYVEKLAAIL